MITKGFIFSFVPVVLAVSITVILSLCLSFVRIVCGALLERAVVFFGDSGGGVLLEGTIVMEQIRCSFCRVRARVH